MATRLILVSPCGLKRVNGNWEPLGAVEQVDPDWHTDADRVPDDEPAGVDGRYAYPRGFKFEITEDTRDAIADIETTGRHPGTGRAATVVLGDWVRTEEIPVPNAERIVAHATPTFTPAQLAHIEALMEARIAELGLQRESVA